MTVYVVLKGHKTGIFEDWSSCQKQINGYSGAVFKKHKINTPAGVLALKSWIEENDLDFLEFVDKLDDKYREQLKQDPEDESVLFQDLGFTNPLDHHFFAVDGGTHGNSSDGSSICEFQIFDSRIGTIIYESEQMVGTNNIAEFLAIVKAISILESVNNQELIIYSDSKTAISWVNRKVCNTKLFENAETNPEIKKTKKAVDYAIAYLKSMSNRGFVYNVKHWNTNDLGEIPADYDRK